jgi:hypothetical protein
MGSMGIIFLKLSSGGDIFNFSYKDDAHHAHWTCEHPGVAPHLSQGHVPYASHNPHNILKTPAFTRGMRTVGAALVFSESSQYSNSVYVRPDTMLTVDD